jgi:hypothetical protein
MHYQSAIAVLMIVPFISRAAPSSLLARTHAVENCSSPEDLYRREFGCLPSVADRLLFNFLVSKQAKVRAFQTISPHLQAISSEHQSSLSCTVPLQASNLHLTTHHKHAFHTCPQRCCLRRLCRGSDHRPEQLPLPHRPKQRLFVQQAYVQ